MRLIAEGRAAHPEVFADEALAYKVEQQVHNLIVENGQYPSSSAAVSVGIARAGSIGLMD